MIELKVPIRLYWDVSPVPSDCPLDYQSICRDILDLKILSINIVDLTPGLSGACLSILECFKGKGTAVSLTIGPGSFSTELLEQLGHLGVRVVLLRINTLSELPSLPDRGTYGPTVGICFDVTPANWRQLPELLRHCSQSGIGMISLPMQRLSENGQSFHLTPGEKRELAMLLQPVLPVAPKLTIHDPFLWKIFFPNTSFPDGGCQAGNTMLYISADGLVYPCPSLPITVGSLHTLSFRTIATSEEKKRVRNEILSLPSPCFDCAEAAICKGGCRGRAFVANRSLDSADPGCLA